MGLPLGWHQLFVVLNVTYARSLQFITEYHTAHRLFYVNGLKRLIRNVNSPEYWFSFSIIQLEKGALNVSSTNFSWSNLPWVLQSSSSLRREAPKKSSGQIIHIKQNSARELFTIWMSWLGQNEEFTVVTSNPNSRATDQSILDVNDNQNDLISSHVDAAFWQTVITNRHQLDRIDYTVRLPLHICAIITNGRKIPQTEWKKRIQ